jgi:gamma-glutamylcyclotransferase (GGCT)/AIG2-like uncharacterized protein YtfP
MGELIFVYGTLKKGFSNHRLLEKDKFISEAETIDKYAMYVHGIPYVNYDEPISEITGEIYQVSKMSLLMIDLLEGHPSWYYRKKIYVETDEGKVYKAWMYFNEQKTNDLVESGTYEKAR